MKRILIIGLLAMLCGCVRVDDDAGRAVYDVTGMPVRFQSAVPLQDSGTARSLVTKNGNGNLKIEWTSADQVGVFARTAEFPIGSNIRHHVVPEEADPSTAWFFAEDNKAIVWFGNVSHYFYAYHPYLPNASDLSAIPLHLPSMQRQASAGSTAHLSKYNVMVAAPVTISGEELGSVGTNAFVKFEFTALFPVVELRVKGTAATAGERIVRAVLSTSDSGNPLTISKGSVDITSVDGSSPLPYRVSEAGGRSVVVEFDESPVLSASGQSSLYFVVAPGYHPKGALTVELWLSSGAPVRFTLSESHLRTNTHYVMERTLGENDIQMLSEGVVFPLCLSFASDGAGKPRFGMVNETEMLFPGGVTLSRERRSEALSGTTYNSVLVFQSDIHSSDWSYLIQETAGIGSRAWKFEESSAYTLSIPLLEELSGRMRIDFRFIPGGFSEWMLEWSPDGLLWSAFNDGLLTHTSSSAERHYTRWFDIPADREIPAGRILYIRLRPDSQKPTLTGSYPKADAGSYARLLHAIIVTAVDKRGNTPVPEGSDVIYSTSFDGCTQGVDVVGLGLERVRSFYDLDGITFTQTEWGAGSYESNLPGMSHIATPPNVYERPGYVRIGHQMGYGSLVTPKLNGIGATARDIAVSFRASIWTTTQLKRDVGEIVVNVVDPAGNSFITKRVTIPSTQFPGDGWTTTSVVLKGVSSDHRVEFSASSAGGAPMRYYLDDIVIRKL